jgi:hypothetical protein
MAYIEDRLEKARKKGLVKKIRTIKPTADTYIHIGILKKKGKRGGTTVSGPIIHLKKS